MSFETRPALTTVGLLKKCEYCSIGSSNSVSIDVLASFQIRPATLCAYKREP